MLDLVALLREAVRQTRQQNRRQRHRVGPGRQSIFTEHRAGKDYGVAFCGGRQECERHLARRELTHGC